VPHREGRARASLRQGIAGGLRGDSSRTDFATLKIGSAAGHAMVAADIEPHGACAQPPAFEICRRLKWSTSPQGIISKET
jgi:hypothetical protein